MTWSHYVDLVGVEGEARRSFYMHEAANSGWDVRELRRQIDSMLFELKTTPLTPAVAGQLNAYLNYYAEEVNDEYDNPPVGIILCTDKRNVDAHYALGGLENRVFASTYVTVMPDEEELAEQVRMAIEANERRALASGEDA